MQLGLYISISSLVLQIITATFLFRSIVWNLATVGSPIGQADFSPPLSKHLYLQKYSCYVVYLITANVKQS